MKRLIVALVVLFSVNAWAQDVQEKQWNGISRVGAHPDQWGTLNYEYVYDMGIQNSTNQHVCMAQADANCNMRVVMAPGGFGGNVRVMDGNGATLSDVIQPTADGIASNAYYHLVTSGFNYVYDGTNAHWDRLRGDTDGALIVNQGTSYPGYGRIQDGDGTTLVDVAVMSGGDIAGTILGLNTISGTYFWDTTATAGFRKWLGALMADDTSNPTPPWVGNFNMVWDATNTNWNRLRGDTSGNLIVNQSTSVPGYNRIQDGDGTTLADVIDTFADNQAVSLNGLMTGSVMYVYDGAALDMLRSGAVGELQVTDVATRPGEDAASDWRKVKKEAIKTYSPAKETSGQILAVPVIVLAAKEILGYPNYCVFIKNLDAANSLTDVDHQVSPDNTTWVDLTEPSSCDTLAAAATCVFCVSGNAYRYVRVRVTAAAVAADVDSVNTWITANVN